MAKILLVEDDNNLREIYEARLQAEGYDIVSARDGEEALTVAMKERPDLIISDVMMPKISGFDMLDIIRSTEETKYVKVIMMTALSQAEDKERATKLGADRYLVKSQVTLEDVAKVAREVLEGASDQNNLSSNDPVVSATSQGSNMSDNSASTATQATATDDTTITAPVASAPADDPALSAITPDDTKYNKQIESEESAIAAQIENFIDAKKTSPEPTQQNQTPESTASNVAAPVVETVATQETEPVTAPEAQPEQEVSKTMKKVINPISDPTASKGPDLESLLKKEEEKEQMAEIAKSVMENKAATVVDPQSVATQNPSLTVNTPPQTVAEESISTVNQSTETLPATESNMPLQNEAIISSTNTPPAVESPAPAPVIPHQNGSSIDGVVPQPATVAPTAPASPVVTTPPATASDTIDPNSISL